MTACAYIEEYNQEPTLLNYGGTFHQELRLPESMDTTDVEDVRARNSLSPSAGPSFHDEKLLKSSVKRKSAGKGVKCVRWDRIHTREFDLVVGDHPMCQDGLPVSLGWQYDDHSCSTKSMNSIDKRDKLSSTTRQQVEQAKLSERRQSYVFPRRLSYEERRERLISVSNLTLDEIKSDEIDLVVRTLNESWEKEDLDEGQNTDVLMAIVEDQTDLYQLADQNLMELDDIGLVPGIDVEFGECIDEDLGDITNFDWTDNEK